MKKAAVAATIADPSICSEDDCERVTYCIGWCHMHFLARFAISHKKRKSEFSF